MLPVIRTVLYLRTVALRRSLVELGWWRLLLLFAFLLWAAFRLISLQSPPAWLITASVIVGALHFSRSDRFFLQTLTPHWAWLMRTEYLLLALPFLFGMLAWPYPPGIAALLVLIGLLPGASMPALRNRQTTRLLSRLPAGLYEWKAGLRKNGWIITAVWVLAALFYWALVAQVALLLLCTIITGSFYIVCEPRIWLDLQGVAAPRRFLRQKAQQAFAGILTVTWPFYLLIAVFHPQQAWLIVPLLLIAGAYISYAVLLKYALYAEGRSLEPFMLHHFIFVGSCAVPLFLPVAVYFWWSNYSKAHRHLSELSGYA